MKKLDLLSRKIAEKFNAGYSVATWKKLMQKWILESKICNFYPEKIPRVPPIFPGAVIHQVNRRPGIRDCDARDWHDTVIGVLARAASRRRRCGVAASRALALCLLGV